jgi:hypothetical protein
MKIHTNTLSLLASAAIIGFGVSAHGQFVATPTDSGRIFADAGVSAVVDHLQFFAGDNATPVASRQNRAVVVFELPTLTPDFKLKDVEFMVYHSGTFKTNQNAGEYTLVPLDLVFIEHGNSSVLGTEDFHATAEATKTGVANKDSSISQFITWTGDSNLTAAVQAAIDANHTHVAFRMQLEPTAPYVDDDGNPVGDGGDNNDNYHFRPYDWSDESLIPSLTLIQ